MEWCLLRHAESAHNRAGRPTGPPDAPLTARGRDQARAVAPLLAAHRFSLVACSPWARCRETAHLAGLRPDRWPPGLGERRLGAAADRHTEVDARLAWDRAPTGGESNRAVALRLLAALEPLAAAAGPGPVLLISHAGPLRLLQGLVDGVPTDQLGRIKIPLCTPSWRTVTAARLRALHAWCRSAPAPGDP